MSFTLNRQRLSGSSDQSPSINERFTNIADVVSEGMGRWWVTVTSIVLVLIWLATGPFFHYSDTWQLMVNTPTTIVEMWIGFLIAAAANRTERRNKELHETMLTLIEKIESEEEEVLQHVTSLDNKPTGVV